MILVPLFVYKARELHGAGAGRRHPSCGTNKLQARTADAGLGGLSLRRCLNVRVESGRDSWDHARTRALLLTDAEYMATAGMR